MLTQDLSVTSDYLGRRIKAERSSKIDLFDTPTTTIVNGEERFVEMASEVRPADLPDELKQKLYTDKVPTERDFEYFERLITQPIQEGDISI